MVVTFLERVGYRYYGLLREENKIFRVLTRRLRSEVFWILLGQLKFLAVHRDRILMTTDLAIIMFLCNGEYKKFYATTFYPKKIYSVHSTTSTKRNEKRNYVPKIQILA